MEDQKLPLGGSPLSAVTPEQKDFVEEQRTHVEEQGGVWTPEVESLMLALTADACETAILNDHDTDASTVQMHIDTSPLFLNQIPESLPEAQRAQAEMSMADIMVYGMQHMCPDDFEQWSEADMELHPEYYGCSSNVAARSVASGDTSDLFWPGKPSGREGHWSFSPNCRYGE